MADENETYIVVTFGYEPGRHLVVHLPTKKVVCECYDPYTAAGIASLGNAGPLLRDG